MDAIDRSATDSQHGLGPLRRLLRECTNPSTSWSLFALLAVACLAIYLPGLGIAELKGEEERRIMPGIDMIRSGDWIQPMIGGEPYHIKPPFINWVVAGTFLVTGVVNEWTARLPSILFMLGFLGVLAFQPCEKVNRRARLFAGLVFLTNLGMWEKGRLIEMEAMLVSINGAACLCWLFARLEGRGPWVQWPVPCLLLAAGLLLKGPAMPVFFYGCIGCVLLAERRVRDLFHPAHLVSFAVAVGAFGAWYVFSAKQETHANVSTGLAHEAFARFLMHSGGLSNWLRIASLSFANFLPWIVLVPMLFRRSAFAGMDDRSRRILVGALWGITLPFIAISFLPGTSARYTMPVFPVAALLLGVVFERHTSTAVESRLGRIAVLGGLAVLAVGNVAGAVLVSPTFVGVLVAVIAIGVAGVAIRNRGVFEQRIGRLWGTTAIAFVAALGYAAFATELLKERERYRPTALALDELVPGDATLHLYKPGPQEFLFYVKHPVDFALEPVDVNTDVDFLAVRRADLEMIRDSGALAGRQVDELYEFTPRIEGEFRLVRLVPEQVAAERDSMNR